VERRPRWQLPIGALVIVSLAVYGIARLQPFEPSAPPAAEVPAGDAANGAALYARSCAGCHGDGGAGGGIGPVLVDTGLDAPAVAGIVAAGRGAMPGGLVTGQDAADVAAYVAQISGGDTGAPPGTTGAATTPAPPAATGGTARLLGRGLEGLAVELESPAPSDWGVWLEGDAGLERIADIAAGDRGFSVADLGLGTVIDGYERVLVGATADAPALRGTIAPERAQELRRLFISDPDVPQAASLLDATAGQINVMRDHIRFLVIARQEGNLANIRFHGEHMVNISFGEPVQDVDGNGDPSNPGDGVGLLGPEGGQPGYLLRILTIAGGPAERPVSLLNTTIGQIAQAGRTCGRAGSVLSARGCVDAAEARRAELVSRWRAVRAQAGNGATITLEAP